MRANVGPGDSENGCFADVQKLLRIIKVTEDY